MLELVKPTITGSRTGTVPPWPMIRRVTPCQPRNSARVTTNDGIRTTLTRTPVKRPISVPTTMAARTAQYQATSWRAISTAITAAQTPLTTPADRSISPSSRTKTRPIASRMIGTRLDEQVGDVQRRRERVRPQRR